MSKNIYLLYVPIKTSHSPALNNWNNVPVQCVSCHSQYFNRVWKELWTTVGRKTTVANGHALSTYRRLAAHCRYPVRRHGRPGGKGSSKRRTKRTCLHSGSARGTLHGNTDGVRGSVGRLVFLNLETFANGPVAKRRKHYGWRMGRKGERRLGKRPATFQSLGFQSILVSSSIIGRGTRGYNFSPQN